MTIPIMFLSDAVSAQTGLGRIARDLAVRLHWHCSDVFDVAAIGYGGGGDAAIPFKEYHLHSIDKWLVPELPQKWDNWARGRGGILMCVWDMSRLYWLGMPQSCPDPNLRRFAERKDIKKWAYHAIDAEGPHGKLSYRIAETMKGFDRVIDYSEFSSKITDNPTWLPHGIDTSIFKPYPRAQARERFAESGFHGLAPDTFLIGIVATNQIRKNWQLGMEVCRRLSDSGLNVRVWIHTDVMDRYWSIGNLIVDYGMVGKVAVTSQRFTDEQMAQLYSACDITLGIGPEGFGYPIAESLACGVPCFAGSYGAQVEFLPHRFQIDPTDYYYEGAFCSKRPVHRAQRWVARILAWNEDRLRLNLWRVSLPERIDWNGPILWPAWEKWFLGGVE